MSASGPQHPRPSGTLPPLCLPPSEQFVDTLTLLEQVRIDIGASRIVLGWWRQGSVADRHLVARDLPPHPDAAIWAAAMDEAIDQGVILHGPTPAPARHITLQHHQLADVLGAPVSTLPLPGGDRPLGAITLVWPTHEAHLRPDDQRLTELGRSLGPWLALLRTVEQPWIWGARERLGARWAGVVRPTTLRGRRLRAALLAVTVAGALWPAAHDVSGSARIEGGEQRQLSAPIDGFIERTQVQPGDTVKAGQTLFELASQDLTLTRDRWRSQIAQHESAYTAAMARSDRSEAALNLARLEEAQAQLALVEAELQRHRVNAPYDGVVVDGDLSQRIGAPVNQGAPLMTVARSGARRVIVEIDEHDIGRIAAGQTGHVRVSAWPWDAQRIRIESVTPLVQFREGRRVYDVRASFVDAPSDEFRPGLIGSARVLTGRSPWLWQATQGVAQRMRMWWWRWWG